MGEATDQAAGVPPREHAVGEAEREQADRAAAADECGRGRGEDDDESGKGEDDVRRAPSVGPDLLLERHRPGYVWKLTATGARSSWSAAKNSRASNPNTPAKSSDGNVWIAVL